MDVSMAQENYSLASGPDARPEGTKEVFVDKETTIPDTRNSPGKNPEKSIHSAATSDKLISTRSSPRRPVTRSLSGRPLKRRIRDDNALDSSSFSADDEVPAELPSPAKKQKTTSAPRKRSTRKSAAATYEETLSTDANHITVSAPQILVPGVAAEPSTSVSTSSQSTPQPITPSASASASPHVPARIGTTRTMRATLPTPVPNLTKKSRGRRVPIRVMTTTGIEMMTDPDAGTDMIPLATESSTDNKKDRRSYVCSVEGCGKCFHRGEHLKRHIRSIHTHEKPFKCTYPECDKNFNRHDNLLQHLKVHKQAQATAAMTASGSWFWLRKRQEQTT
ncbi:hypothetical protein BDP27DRAFT_231185 [Rhodocollybia butyracea]|uniref:C2H2-type domain-containing protein n=1 Tax=Rhodocollybia butyracea TaxID=206335 RepID=A0A9P5PJB8_9AGAR|nr:hypothetical protein BDP27DRAFT_231185 [Rhodocollybia butyracea]